MLIITFLLGACKEDETCDEFTESNLVVKLIHTTAKKSFTLTNDNFDSVAFYRINEYSAYVVGTQFNKITLFYKNSDSVYIKKDSLSDTVIINGINLESLRLSTDTTGFILNASIFEEMFIHEDKVDSILIAGLGDDIEGFFYNLNTASGTNPNLPINFTNNISTYTLSTGGITDTFQISYTMEQELLSPTCGFIFNYTINVEDTINNFATPHIIDSVFINNKYVKPQSTYVHLSIYY